MKTFVRNPDPDGGHTKSSKLCLMSFTVGLCFVFFKPDGCPTWLAWFGVVVIVVASFAIAALTGLYIDDERMYYRDIWKKEVDAGKVAVVIVARVVRPYHPYNSFLEDITDESGEPLYAMMFIDEYIPWRMKPEQIENLKLRNLSVHSAFEKHVLFSTVYDQAVLDHFLTLNPNIIVF